MKVTIDNLDEIGPRDYTSMLDVEYPPQVLRHLNRPAEMTAALVAEGAEFRLPVLGARIALRREDGTALFTGNLRALPECERVGWGTRGDVYRYHLKAIGQEYMLDKKAVRTRAPYTLRTAGNILQSLAGDVSQGLFDTSGVEDAGTIARFRSTPARKWSQQAAEVALRVRSAYRVDDGEISLAPVGATRYSIDERDAGFSPEALRVQRLGRTINDVIVVGKAEPYAWAKDYFIGDGYTLRFGLSQVPFMNRASTLLEEEYKGDALRSEYWNVSDAGAAVSVANGKLSIATPAGSQSAVDVGFVEPIELGAAAMLQHGDVEFTGASDGIIGGLYNGSWRTIANCIAGFKVSKSGAQSSVQAIVNGALTGTAVATVAGHRYVLGTRFYADAIYRKAQTFYSSVASTVGYGGEEIGGDLRLVLEVHEIDPANPATIAAPSRVLYEGVVSGAPGFCSYALVSGSELRCNISYTRLRRIANVQVRSAAANEAARTRLVGPSSEGGECSISGSALYFYASNPPAPNEALVASYWVGRRSAARLMDEASVIAESKLYDDGFRSEALEIVVPEPRSSEDCANAARAMLDDSTGPAWSGEYTVHSTGDWQDVWPGDGIDVDAQSGKAAFGATVREVSIQVRDLSTDEATVKVGFANDAAVPLAYLAQEAKASWSLDLEAVPVGTEQVKVADLPGAEVTAISSTFVTLDAGATPLAGGGFEVRRSDLGWGTSNDRNLVGRFATRSFNVPRLARVQDYCIRMYDSNYNYSQHSTLLHVDYPL